MATPTTNAQTAARPPVTPRRLSGFDRFILSTFAWLDERFRLRAVANLAVDMYYQWNMQLPRSHTEKYKLRSIWYWYPVYSLGSLTFIAFVVATITGVLLTLYYVPSTAPAEVGGLSATEAWKSIVYIMVEVPFGFMIRALHFWSAMVMVAAVFLHMMRVYFTQSYKKPRELNWIIGFVLLVLTLGLGYTGYLLPWSQLSFWAGRIGIEMAKSSPFLGTWVAGFMFGGAELGQFTITRMYVFHVILLPIIAFGLAMLHMVIVWIQGIAEPH